ncbi:MAG: peptidylprolyl isomerase [Bacteroidota bacterium]
MLLRSLLLLLIVATFAGCGGDDTDYLVTIKTPYGDMKAILYEETPLHKQNFIKLAESGQYDSTIFHRVIENFMVQGGDVNAKPGNENAIDYTIPAEFVNKFVHEKGALAAARQGDNVNPQKESSGCQFYIAQGIVYDENALTTDFYKLNMAIRQLLQDSAYTGLRDQFVALQQAGDNQGIQDLTLQYKDTVISRFNAQVTKDVAPEQLAAYTTVGGIPHLDYAYTVFGKVVEGIEVMDKIAAQPTGRADKPIEDIFMTVQLEKVSKSAITEKYGYEYPNDPS